MATTEDQEPPPVELLQRAYNRLRRPYWENTLEAALAHPIRGKILVGLARNLQRTALYPRQEISPKHVTIPGALEPFKPLPLDGKRLASGERDDDD